MSIIAQTVEENKIQEPLPLPGPGLSQDDRVFLTAAGRAALKPHGSLSTGFYCPSQSFLSASEHVAVMDADGGLVAVTGYSYADEDAEIVEQSIADARLFAAAPELLEGLKTMAALVQLMDPRPLGSIPPVVANVIDETLGLVRAVIARAEGHVK